MKKYVRATAVLLAVLMASGCGKTNKKESTEAETVKEVVTTKSSYG